MKKIVIFFSLLVIMTSCCKDKCISEISDKIKGDIHYEYVGCTGHEEGYGNYQWKFNTSQEYIAHPCTPNNIPIPIGFNGIIIAQGVKVPYAGPNPGDQGYSLSTIIFKDECEKTIDFRLIIKTIDTSRVFEHMENAIVSLNGIDSTYSINFSHEIIPYNK